jgi:DNA-binding CsgD family transcriptional regulator
LEPAVQLRSKLGRSWCCGSPIDYSNILPNAIEALVALDRLQTAEGLLAALEKQTGFCMTLPNCVITDARSHALVAAAKGDLEAASAALADALKAHERLADPFERGRTMLVLGTVERRRKRKRNARRALEEAGSIFDRLGARLWSQKTQAELQRVTGSRVGGLELTPTELQITELVAEGRSNKEIAAQLFMSVRTVETNLSNIYRRLGLESRAELAARFSAPGPEQASE